jgi:hypothetical protein
VEATLAKIKALPGYVKHAPAAFKEHINAIQAIEDPYEQGKAVGELVGKVLPVGGAVGKIASKLGRWGKVAKPKKRQERIGEKGGAAGGREIIVRSLGDPNTLRGAKMSEVSKLIPKSWEKMSLKKGQGVRYLDPSNPGESILVEYGWKNAKDLLHSGRYVRIARDGKILRIPLSGNPVL